MGKEYDSKREKRKLIVFFILMILFSVLTLIGGILVIRCYYHSLYSLFPALSTLIFLFLCKRTRKKIQKHEEQ